jgi:hypothetical protein
VVRTRIRLVRVWPVAAVTTTSNSTRRATVSGSGAACGSPRSRRRLLRIQADSRSRMSIEPSGRSHNTRPPNLVSSFFTRHNRWAPVAVNASQRRME